MTIQAENWADILNSYHRRRGRAQRRKARASRHVEFACGEQVPRLWIDLVTVDPSKS